MRLLLILLVAVFGSVYRVSGSNDFSGICYMCQTFTENGQGFMQHPNQTMCCYYYECWRVDGSTVIDQVLRTCPPGTWFNNDPGHRGAPCTANKPYQECVSQCGDSEPITKSVCHLYPNPSNPQQFGTLNPPPGGPWIYEGTCRNANWVFDHSACTCIPITVGSCFCKLDIGFVGGVQDDSCHNAHVINSDNPVTIQADATMPDGSVGVFDGSNFLSVPMYSGLDEGDCYVGCMSMGVYFRTGAVINDATLFDSRDCWSGLSFHIMIQQGGAVRGEIGQQSGSGVVSANTWQYVSVVYKHARRRHKLWFYVMTMAEAADCENNCNCPDPITFVNNNQNCLTGKSCGLTVGGSDPVGFFEGLIGRVQISHKCHPMACAGTHCLSKGRRNRVG